MAMVRESGSSGSFVKNWCQANFFSKTVVSNTTPLITLASIDKIEILQTLFGKIYIPMAVLKEVKAGKGKIGYFEIDSFDWIIPQKITNVFSRNFLIDLDDGEAETIILAEELPADIVLLEENITAKDELLLRDMVRQNILYFDPTKATYYPQGKSYHHGIKSYFQGI